MHQLKGRHSVGVWVLWLHCYCCITTLAHYYYFFMDTQSHHRRNILNFIVIIHILHSVFFKRSREDRNSWRKSLTCFLLLLLLDYYALRWGFSTLHKFSFSLVPTGVKEFDLQFFEVHQTDRHSTPEFLI